MHLTKRNKKRKFHYYIVSLLHCLIVLSCAQITTPTGGPKDSTPPTVLKSNPPNNTTNFHQKEIKMVFNEWIQPLTNPKIQIIISPNTETFPKIDIARNELSIKLKDSLQPNTTYSIFFGDNIKDNNEGNALTNFKYIFSTGPFIDSLRLKGHIETSLDKIPDNTYLLLYKEKEDSVFTKKRPFYITKVTADGRFNLENVKEDDYRVYVLSDKNGNYYYDLPTEAIGFSDSMVHLKSNIDTLVLPLFLPEDSILRVFDFDRTIKGGILHLTFNKELSLNKDEVTVEILGNTSISPIVFPEKEPKKMTVYFPKLVSDTNTFTLILKNNGRLIDSLSVRTESRQFKNVISFFNDTTAYKTLGVIETKPLKLMASFYSLENIDTAKIEITDTSGTKIPYTISREEDLQTYSFAATWKSGMKYQLSISDSAFVDLVGNYSKKQKFSFFVSSAKKAGNLLITYELPQKNRQYIALFKDNTGKVLDKRILRDSQTVKIDYGLQYSGVYSVEVIDDANENGIWNSGSFAKKTLPEKIYKELKPIIIKENWDAEEIIKVDFSAKFKVPINTEDVKKENLLNQLPDKIKSKRAPGNDSDKKE